MPPETSSPPLPLLPAAIRPAHGPQYRVKAGPGAAALRVRLAMADLVVPCRWSPAGRQLPRRVLVAPTLFVPGPEHSLVRLEISRRQHLHPATPPRTLLHQSAPVPGASSILLQCGDTATVHPVMTTSNSNSMTIVSNCPSSSFYFQPRCQLTPHHLLALFPCPVGGLTVQEPSAGLLAVVPLSATMVQPTIIITIYYH